MRIAIPLANGRLNSHFGQSQTFAFVDIEGGRIARVEELPAPEHAHGVIPAWVKEQGANIVIAGGMGGHARQLLAEADVTVITGAPEETPEALVQAYLAGTLLSVDRPCNHGC